MTGGKFEKNNGWGQDPNPVESEVVRKVHTFDLDSRSFNMGPEMQGRRYFHCSAMLGNKLYVYAGHDG